MKFLLSAALFIAALLILASLLYPKPTTTVLPRQFIGNWINKDSNEWKFGFFEEFVIYRNGFWKYNEVHKEANGSFKLVITSAGNTVKLHVEKTLNNHLFIKEDGRAVSEYILMGDSCPDYNVPDHKAFAKQDFTIDSATIIGYYRNLDVGIKGFVQRFFRSPFEVSVADFLTAEEVKYFGDIDDDGRFKITFPVMNAQELYVDWKRTRIRAVVEPGDTLFLFADVADYLPNEEDKKNYHSYVNRPKVVLFMGKNARLNNELKQYIDPAIAIDKGAMKGLDDMQYLHRCEQVYQKRLANFNQYVGRHPHLSDKFVQYKQIDEKYDFASNLMQHRFDLSGSGHQQFQKGYLEYVEQNFPLDNELDYTITRYFGRFLSDYLGYLSGNNSVTNVLFSEIGVRLEEDGKLTTDLATQIREIDSIYKNRKLYSNGPAWEEELKRRSDKLNAVPQISKTAQTLQSEKNMLDISVADSLLTNRNLRQLWFTNRYRYWFEVLRKPLSVQMLNVFRNKVDNPGLVNYIEQLQAHYGVVENEGKSFQANTMAVHQLKDSKNAQKLLHDLLEPHKGKVVYIDFWGTWCSPCRRDLKVANVLKQKVASKNVVYLYLANRSPEDTWKNLIQELHLTGDNVIHHRLPDEQQAMVERQLGVNTFPTYMLVNKKGVIVNKKADSPSNTDYTAAAIKELL